jgi:heptosyltransferase-3
LKRNILIFHSGALGDFVLTWPLATALGRMFAQSRIVYVTAGQKGELARQVLGVEAVDSENGWHVLFAEDAKPQAAQMKWLDGASLIFSFVAEPGDVWFTNVRRLAPEARIICIRPRPERDYHGHVTQFLVDQLRELPPVQQGVEQIIASLSQRAIKTQNGKPMRIVIHPGAGAIEKCWPAEKYLELIARLQQGGSSVRVLLGEVERERWPAERIAQFESAAETVWPLSYLDLLDQLREASAFVGNDSGPAHLAAIIGVPTITLFGTSDPDRWHPLGPHVKILAKSFDRLEPDEVFTEMSQIIQ